MGSESSVGREANGGSSSVLLLLLLLLSLSLLLLLLISLGLMSSVAGAFVASLEALLLSSGSEGVPAGSSSSSSSTFTLVT